VGFVDNDLLKQRMRYYGAEVLGKWSDIPDLIKKYDVGVIILADYRLDSQDYQAIKKLVVGTPAKFVVMPDILISVNQLVNPVFKGHTQNETSNNTNPACLDCLAKQFAPYRKHYWKNMGKQLITDHSLGRFSNNHHRKDRKKPLEAAR
jgi:hypothetical protein